MSPHRMTNVIDAGFESLREAPPNHEIQHKPLPLAARKGISGVGAPRFWPDGLHFYGDHSSK